MATFGYAVKWAMVFDPLLAEQYNNDLDAYVDLQNSLPSQPGNSCRYGTDTNANFRAAEAATERLKTFEWRRKNVLEGLRFDGTDVLTAAGRSPLPTALAHATTLMGGNNSGAVVYEIFDKDYLDNERNYQPPVIIGIAVVAVCR